MLEENKIMADALRKIGQIAVPPDATLRDWNDAFVEARSAFRIKHADVLA
jgi:hypothetical protein